ncbi:RHS repeat-associated core domain-containing protein [Pseudomonas sp. NPDC087336]|uniref:RHS repeat-associated core domain-containing protein n=1 Tax=Pseudomonas sp. NPDC087336 TaxID=3364436 RepID=UPI0038135459
MSDSSLNILCRYQYDPLDRLTGVGLLAGDHTQRFYQKSHLTTEVGQQTQRTILRHEAQPLAQQQSEAGLTETTLLATDRAHSLLHSLTQTNSRHWAYTAYGHHPIESGLSSLLGFNGECPDILTGHYLLGIGKRAYNPTLMRFNSPDKLSPFGDGGINPHAYCERDPINFGDPTGTTRFRFMIEDILSTTGKKPRSHMIADIVPELLDKPQNFAKQNRPLAIPRRSTTDHSRLTKFDNTGTQQQPSTSKLISQSQDTTNRAVPVQHQKMSSAAVKRKLKQDAGMYREFAKKTKHERPINPKLETKMSDLREELHKKALKAPGAELRNIAQSIRYTEDQQDAYAFRQLAGKK